MRVVKIKELENSLRDVQPTGCRSIRAIVESDNMGFSVHKTMIPAGEPQLWHYPHHLEACYCIAGRGKLKNLDKDEEYEIKPDTIYLLDEHDKHTFQAIKDTILISVFNPPVRGDEVHDKNGHYPPSESKRKLAKKIIEAVNSTTNDYDAFDEILELL